MTFQGPTCKETLSVACVKAGPAISGRYRFNTSDYGCSKVHVNHSAIRGYSIVLSGGEIRKTLHEDTHIKGILWESLFIQ